MTGQYNHVAPTASQKTNSISLNTPRNLTCKVPNARSVVVSAYSRPYRVYLHDEGKDTIVGDSIATGATTGNWFEANIRAQIEYKLVNSGQASPLIVDIGANIGIHALYFASLGYEIHGFEPLVENYELLVCSIAANQFYNLNLNNVGLGPKATEVCMSSDNGNMGHSFIDPESQCASKMRVEVFGTYLQNVLKGRVPYLIKIDVEGYEFNALESATDYFKKYGKPKYIFSEFNNKFIESTGRKAIDYILWLESLGYTIVRDGNAPVSSTNMPVGPVHWDILAYA
jgi:FkbM family methyltransferase